MNTVLDLLLQTLQMIWTVFVETAPFLLLGLFLAGWLKIILQAQGINNYMGKPNLRSALYAALFGMPLPICSCGAVPLSLSLRDKGASREANLSLLISTPETSVDTLIITWGLLGPVMMIVRPIASFITAIFAAVLSIADRTGKAGDRQEEFAGGSISSNSLPMDNSASDDRYHVVGVKGFFRSLYAAIAHIPGNIPARKKESESAEEAKLAADDTEIDNEKPVPFGQLTRDALHYGFVRMLDDISLWFVIGIIAAGIIAALVPETWFTQIPGGRIGSLIFVLIISIPMYLCAVESTPIAAMLILKGLSPGAALVFLLAGPATNLATMLLLRQTYGRRFLHIYLTAIIAVSLAAGYLFDSFLNLTGWQVAPTIGQSTSFGIWPIIATIAALHLIVLIAFSFYRLPWKEKWESAKGVGERIMILFGFRNQEGPLHADVVKKRWRRWILATVAIALFAYFASGIYVIGPGNTGFKLRLGKLTAENQQPGLHYRLPWPVEKYYIFRTHEIRKSDLGFRTDPEQIRQMKQNPLLANDSGWHSFFTNMNAQPEESTYIIGDEIQLEAKFTVYFRISDARKFFFEYAKNRSLVALTAESVLREYLASRTIDNVLTSQRREIPDAVIGEIQALLDFYGIGVEVDCLLPVDLHPPIKAVAAFRDVASATEDRATSIHKAFAAREEAMPRARGDAKKLVASAKAEKTEIMSKSQGRAENFRMRLEAYHEYETATYRRMYLESMETSLTGIPKILVPPVFNDQQRLRLWGTGNQEVPFP